MADGQYCKYHPEEPAAWYCRRCDVPFCMTCIPPDESSYAPKCTLCRSYLEPVGISGSITPFWHQLGHFFAYPLATLFLLIGFLMAVASFWFPLHESSTGFMNLVFMILCISFLLKMCFSIMDVSAKGNLSAPTFGELLSTKNNWIFIKLVGINIILSLILGKLGSISWILWLVTVIFIVLSYPAMNLILSIDKSMFSAINPVRILQIMSAMGWSYVILFLLMGAFVASLLFAQELLDKSSPVVAVPVITFLQSYLLFAMYHMFGYAIYQYHFELGVAIDRRTLQSNAKISHSKRTAESGGEASSRNEGGVLVEAEIFIQEGRFEAAQQALIEAIRQQPNYQEAYQRLYKLLVHNNDQKLYRTVVEKHISELFNANNQNLLKKVFVDAQDVIPPYIPSAPDIVVMLIQQLNRKDEVKHAVALLNHMKRNHIEHPELAKASFVLGKNILEKLNQPKQAKQIIAWAANLANGDLKQQMNAYLSHLS